MTKLMKKKKGFTLVELIVVIAIIGILAAVLIPTISGFIDRARLSADKQDATNMNLILKTHFESDIYDEIEASDIRTIVNMYDKNYSFKPRTKNASFWYDRKAELIKVLTMAEARGRTELFGSFVVNAEESEDRQLEELFSGMLYLDRAGSDLATALYGIRNASSSAEFNTNYDKIPSEFKNHVNNYNPATTLYVNTIGGFTDAVTQTPPDGFPYKSVKKVLFADGVRSVPVISVGADIKVEKDNVPQPIKIPVAALTIESGALSAIASKSKLVAYEARQLKLEIGSISYALRQQNPRLPEEISFNALMDLKVIAVIEDNNITHQFVLSEDFSLRYAGLDTDNKPIARELYGNNNPTSYLVDGVETLVARDNLAYVLNSNMRLRVLLEESGVNKHMTGIEYSFEEHNGVKVQTIKIFDNYGLIAKKQIRFVQLSYVWEAP